MSAMLTEAKMAEAFARFMNTQPHAQPKALPQFAELEPEVDCLQGRPDFIGVVRQEIVDSACRTAGLAEALSVPSSAALMALLKRRAPRTENYLVRMTGLSAPVVHRVLVRLQRQEIIQQVGSGYALAAHLPDLGAQLWAFELKLDHWQRALFQACQYQAFAHVTVVVISERGARRVERQYSRFESLGVGLAAFDTESCGLRVLVQPERRKPLSQRHHLFALGRILARQLRYAADEACL